METIDGLVAKAQEKLRKEKELKNLQENQHKQLLNMNRKDRRRYFKLIRNKETIVWNELKKKELEKIK